VVNPAHELTHWYSLRATGPTQLKAVQSQAPDAIASTTTIARHPAVILSAELKVVNFRSQGA
jgi:hypothetical protein